MGKQEATPPTVTARNGIVRLTEAIAEGQQLRKSRPVPAAAYKQWAHRAKQHLVACFGSGHDSTQRFISLAALEPIGLIADPADDMFGIRLRSGASSPPSTGRSREEALDLQIPHLEDCKKELERRSAEAEENSSDPREMDLVFQVLRRFDRSAKALAKRPRQDKQSKGYVITDEYDVQDLLFAILKPLVPDLDREDPIQKTAGHSGRADLTSKKLGLIIELKYGNNPERADKFARECMERIPIYSKWPGLKLLVFYVFDPHGHLEDPDNFVEGFHSPNAAWDGKEFDVMAIVAPHAG